MAKKLGLEKYAVLGHSGGGFVALTLAVDFPNEATLYLGDIEVPLPDDSGEVCFSQIRLVLADGEDSNYVIENDDPTFKRHPLRTPSGQQSGIKILVKEESCSLSV